jgi:hypothetical protein
MRIAANLSRTAWACLLFHCFLWGCSTVPARGPRLPPKVEHAGAINAMLVDLAPGEPLTHESHRAANHVLQLEKQPVQILGFFAPAESDAQGVYCSRPRPSTSTFARSPARRWAT